MPPKLVCTSLPATGFTDGYNYVTPTALDSYQKKLLTSESGDYQTYTRHGVR
ncbi:MAG: hypothetical protein IPN29_04900 [Saprospiraceae bacterium]|nr:hypothetical protein [Saprospiraceae bacterium]